MPKKNSFGRETALEIILNKLNEIGIHAGLAHVPNHLYTCFKESYVKLPETEIFSQQQIAF